MSHKYVNLVKNSKCFAFCFRQIANATCAPLLAKANGDEVILSEKQSQRYVLHSMGNAKECLALMVEVYKHNVT